MIQTPEEMNLMHCIFVHAVGSKPHMITRIFDIPDDGLFKEIDKARASLAAVKKAHADQVFVLTTLVVR